MKSEGRAFFLIDDIFLLPIFFLSIKGKVFKREGMEQHVKGRINSIITHHKRQRLESPPKRKGPQHHLKQISRHKTELFRVCVSPDFNYFSFASVILDYNGLIQPKPFEAKHEKQASERQPERN